MREGTTIGRYRLDRRIGEGGMGIVYAATDEVLGRQVAVKVMSARVAADPATRTRFEHEAAAMARLDSPHVTTIYDHGLGDGASYLVMQYVAGGDLGSLLARRGPLPAPLAVELVAQIADALEVAHQAGIIHCDVKPTNVLIDDPDARPLRGYLCDFGIAQADERRLTTWGAVPGTWNYLAPELGDGAPPSPASDVYALGCVLWEALSGRPPYTGTQFEVADAHRSAAVPQTGGSDPLSRRVDQVLRKAMAKRPELRYPSAARMREDLRTAPGARGPASDGRRGRRLPVRAAGGVALAVVLAGGLAWTLGGQGLTPGVGGATATSTAPATSSAAPALPGRHGATGDLDGDGRGDVRVTLPNGLFDLSWTYDGSSLGRPVKSSAAMPSGALVVGDIDGDGVQDAITVGTAGRNSAHVTVVRSAGPATTTDVAVPAAGVDPVTGDFDGDGDDDLALAARVGGHLRLWVLRAASGKLGAPATWFTSRQRVPRGARLYPGDFDGDGAVDLALDAPRGSDPGAAQQLRFLRSDGSHRFVETGGGRMLAGWPEGSVQLTSGDPDGDGTAELIEYAVPGMENSGIVSVIGLGTHGFEAARRWINVSGGIASPLGDRRWRVRLVVADLDGDGKDDLARISGPDANAGWLVDALLSTGRAFRSPTVASAYGCGNAQACDLPRLTVWAPAGTGVGG